MSVLLNNTPSTTFPYYPVHPVTKFETKALLRPHSLPSARSSASSNASVANTSQQGNTLVTRIQRSEPCFITKRPSYTLEKAHWVNAVRNDAPRKAQIEARLKGLGIVHESFDLNDLSNLTHLDRMLHVSLDKYGFFAVTASLETLQGIIKLVEAENNIWQKKKDRGIGYVRGFDFLETPLVDAKYELVVLHPQHFLPMGSSLTFFTPVDGKVRGTEYVVGFDGTLRESPGLQGSPCLPPFMFDEPRRGLKLNVFLVVMNAGIKFRRYRRMSDMPPLAADVKMLIDKTMELMDLIYWVPKRRDTPHWNQFEDPAVMDVDDDDVGDRELGKKRMRKEDDQDDQDDTIGKSGKRTKAMRGRNVADAGLDEMAWLGGASQVDSDEDEPLGLNPDSYSDANALDPERLNQWRQSIEVQ